MKDIPKSLQFKNANSSNQRWSTKCAPTAAYSRLLFTKSASMSALPMLRQFRRFCTVAIRA